MELLRDGDPPPHTSLLDPLSDNNNNNSDYKETAIIGGGGEEENAPSMHSHTPPIPQTAPTATPMMGICIGAGGGGGGTPATLHQHKRSTLFCDRFRFFIVVLGTLCLTSIFSNMLTLNFTLICMESQSQGNLSQQDAEHTLLIPAVPAYIHPIHDYSHTAKAVFHWSVAIAAMLATFPFSWFCTHYGARWIFFATGVSAALANGIIPLAAYLGLKWMVLARIVQGIAYASDFAVIGVICTRWAPLKENAKFLSFLTCFSALASFLTNAVSGVICDSRFGWPWVHYAHCLVSLLLFFAWIIFYTDDPRNNYFVTPKELALIHRDKSQAHCNHQPFVPYKEIGKDKVVWTVWLNAFAVILSEFFLFIYAPTYIKNVLNYSSTETGFLGSLTSAIHIPFKLVCGYMSDTFDCLLERQKLCLYNSIALLCPAIIYIYLCYVPSHMPGITVVLFALVQATLGFNCGGYYKCSALISRQYAEFVIAFTQFIKCAVFFVAPLLYFVFIQDEANATQWHVIFYIIAGTLIGANSLFLVYATDKPCEFTKITAPPEGERDGEREEVGGAEKPSGRRVLRRLPVENP